MWKKNTLEPVRQQMTIWSMRIACWVPKAENKPSEYVTLIAFPLQQWLNERASLLRYTYYMAGLFKALNEIMHHYF